MKRRPPMSTRTYTLCPDTTLFRSQHVRKLNRAYAGLGIEQRQSGECLCRAVRSAHGKQYPGPGRAIDDFAKRARFGARSEEHTSALQSLMRRSYAVFCLKQKR